MPETGRIIELSLELAGDPEGLLRWLRARGIDDVVEASCDFLDSDSAAATLASHAEGGLRLPSLIYSYDPAWVAQLKAELLKEFGAALKIGEKTLADELWQQAWQAGFEYLETERFIIGAEDSVPARAGRIAIQLRSGTVFGSGQHATTQALIRLLEREQPRPGERFLDVGTGTGVLCFVAHHVGFRTIWGTDIEADAIASARYNQLLNGIQFGLLEGSLPAAEEKFDCVVCNILPPTLTHLLPDLLARLQRGGRLYLAGMHEANEDEVLTYLQQQGSALSMMATHRERGWTARLYQKA